MYTYPYAIGFTSSNGLRPQMADYLIRAWATKAGYSLWQVFSEESPWDADDSNRHQRFRALMHTIRQSDRPVTLIVTDLTHLGTDDTVRTWRLRMLRWAGATVVVVPPETDVDSETPSYVPPEWLDNTPIFSELVGQGAR